MLYAALKKSMEQNLWQKFVSENETYTYENILKQAQQLSKRLIGDKYGIYCEKKINAIVAILASLEAHKTAVLLCPEYGQAFNERIQMQTGLKNYIYETEEQEIQVVTKDLTREEELTDVAFIIHTAGSTGNAKGVMLTQRNILVNVLDALEYYPVDVHATVLICRPIYHTMTAVCQLFTGLLSGAKLILTEAGCTIPYLVAIIKKYEVTHVTLTPSFIKKLLSVTNKKESLSSITNIGVGGECISKIAVKNIKEGFPKAKIFHTYGMTEGGPRITCLPCEDFGKDYRCVGKALKSVMIGLLDELGNFIQDSNICGEIIVKGPNIMKGYYNDVQSTEKVLKDGWYHTGDRGFLDDRGYLYVLGRKDNMIIRNGVNIWISDIEQELMKHEDILDVYVCAEASNNMKIKAYVVCKGRNVNSLEVSKWCNRHLPKCYAPDRFVFIDKIGLEKVRIKCEK